VVAVEVDDQPGGLNAILQILSSGGVNVEYMYAFVQQSSKTAIIVFRFDKTDQAIELLGKKGITVIPGSVLYNL